MPPLAPRTARRQSAASRCKRSLRKQRRKWKLLGVLLTLICGLLVRLSSKRCNSNGPILRPRRACVPGWPPVRHLRARR